jgi:hypothetical protein
VLGIRASSYESMLINDSEGALDQFASCHSGLSEIKPSNREKARMLRTERDLLFDSLLLKILSRLPLLRSIKLMDCGQNSHDRTRCRLIALGDT